MVTGYYLYTTDSVIIEPQDSQLIQMWNILYFWNPIVIQQQFS